MGVVACSRPGQGGAERRRRAGDTNSVRQLCAGSAVGRLAPSLNDRPGSPSSSTNVRLGILLGAGAVVFWSFGAPLVYLGAKAAGTWPFVAVASLTGGGLQLLFRRIYHGELRSALWLPWRLWVLPIVCFVCYGLVWPWALVSSNPKQVFGVSLINYLWPVLTVLFSVCLVPGVRLTTRTVVALCLALAGLLCANLSNLRELSSAGGEGASVARQLLPYGLALLAATTWGLYSAFLVRWRAWARNYITSPLGFIVIGLLAGGVVAVTRPVPATWTPFGAAMTVLYGVGPLAAGYLLWELALPRARVQTLSLVAAATPILSTALLCGFLRTPPGPELAVAALLVSGGVLLSVTE